MKGRNSDRLFALLEAKEKKQGVPLEKEDLNPLLLSPLMSGRLTIGERIVKSIFYQSSPNAVTKTELEKMQAVMYTLALKFLSKKDLGKVKEMIFMTELGQMLVDDGIEIGLAKGESKIVAMIRKKLAKGLTISAISEELELDGTYVKKVISLISENYLKKRSGNSRNPHQPELMKQERQTAAARMDNRRFQYQSFFYARPILLRSQYHKASP